MSPWGAVAPAQHIWDQMEGRQTRVLIQHVLMKWDAEARERLSFLIFRGDYRQIYIMYFFFNPSSYEPSRNPLAGLLRYTTNLTDKCTGIGIVARNLTAGLNSLQICVDSTTKDELHIVEVEGQDAEGQKVQAVLASLKPSTLPSVSRRLLLQFPYPFSSCLESKPALVKCCFLNRYQ